MADNISEISEIDLAVAHRVNAKFGGTPGGNSLLSSALGTKVIESEEKIVQLEGENVRDGLTGVYNRRFLDQELAKIGPTDQISVVMLDIDGFKPVNDNFGHAAGDAVLKSVARILQNNVKTVGNGERDIVGRYGGEEFLIIFPELTDSKLLNDRTEIIRKQIEESFTVRYGRQIRVTASMGVAIKKTDETPEEFVNRADQAMYLAKNEGKNRVIFSK